MYGERQGPHVELGQSRLEPGHVPAQLGPEDLGLVGRKAVVRAALRASRRRRVEAMTAPEHESAAQKLALNVLKMLGRLQTATPTCPGTVALYLAYGSEPPTNRLVALCLAQGWRVLLPVLLEDRDLDWVQARDADHPLTHSARAAEVMESVSRAGGRLGRAAIAQADAVVVPALAVDAAGTRLGQGGGSYDRALARLPHRRPIAALLWEGEFIPDDLLPFGARDRPVTMVVSPSGIVEVIPVSVEGRFPSPPFPAKSVGRTVTPIGPLPDTNLR